MTWTTEHPTGRGRCHPRQQVHPVSTLQALRHHADLWLVVLAQLSSVHHAHLWLVALAQRSSVHHAHLWLVALAQLSSVYHADVWLVALAQLSSVLSSIIIFKVQLFKVQLSYSKFSSALPIQSSAI